MFINIWQAVTIYSSRTDLWHVPKLLSVWLNVLQCKARSTAADQLKILIAINRTIKIFNRESHQNKKHNFVAQNSSVISGITSIARCKS